MSDEDLSDDFNIEEPEDDFDDEEEDPGYQMLSEDVGDDEEEKPEGKDEDPEPLTKDRSTESPAPAEKPDGGDEKEGEGDEKDGGEEPEQPPDEKPAEEEPESDQRKLEVKYEDGEVERLTKDEVLERLQAHRAGQEDIEKAERGNELVKNILEGIREDPLGTVLQVLGGAFESPLQARNHLLDHAMNLIQEELEFQNLPPEKQVEIRSREEIEERDRIISEYRAKEEARERESKEFEAYQELLSEIRPALKGVDLPDQPVYVRMMAERIKAAAETGREISVHDAAKLVKRDVERSVRDMLGGLTPEAVMALRPDLEDQIKQRSIEKVKAQRAASMKAPRGESEKREKPVAATKTYRDDELPW